jgi:SAM-dependent methyltransferase
MRKPYCEADGIFTDSYYSGRLKVFSPERVQIFQPFVDKIISLVGRKAKVLDLGAGEGFFAKCCAQNGLDVVALEGSSEAVRYARESLGVDSRKHNLKNPIEFIENYFDFIIYHEVYEHVTAEINKNVFKEAFKLLKPKGYFWVMSVCKYDLVERMELEHVNNTTPTELRKFGEEFGFKGEILRPYFNISLFTPFFYDRDLNINPVMDKFRRFLKRHYYVISLVFAPFWYPIWIINSNLLHWPILDFVTSTCNLIFKKNAN